MPDINKIKSLFFAAKKDRVETLTQLLREFETPDICYSKAENMSLLAWAAYHGSIKCMKYLMAQGADINEIESEVNVDEDEGYFRDGYAPIVGAAVNEKPQAFELLLSAGAEIAIEGRDSIHLFEFAIKQGRLDWLKTLFSNDYLLKKHYEDGDLLELVNDEDILTYMISLGFDIHKLYFDEYSAFVNAARMNRVSQLTLFIRHADAEKIKGEEGYIAFIKSDILENSDIAHQLIAAGVPLTPKEAFTDDYTPLMDACEYGNVDLAKKMMNNGADITYQSEEGYTSLIAAVRGNCEALIIPLIEHGVDINSEWEGGTALDVARAKELLPIVALLEKAGARATGDIPETIEDELWRANNRIEVPMSYLESLVTQLKICIPSLNTQEMLNCVPDYFTEDAYDYEEEKHIILDWMFDCLEEQGLMEYEERRQYCGFLPEIKTIEHLDVDEEYDPELITDMIVESQMWAHEVPYLEHINYFLKPHDLMLVSFGFDDLHMMCVIDNEQEVNKLDEILSEYKINMFWHEPMSLDECLKLMSS